MSLCAITTNQMSFGSNQDLLIVENKNLKDLLLLNLDLIQNQEETIVANNKKIASLQDENKTLKLRLERIERRMLLVKPKNMNSRSYEWKIKNHAKKINKSNGSKSKINSKSLFIRNTPKSKVKTYSTKSKITSSIIKSSLSDNSKPKFKSFSKIFQTELHYYVNNHFENIPDVQTVSISVNNVEVPTWRIKHSTPLYVMEGTENLDTHVFDKRHQRLELEEKKRKKWDSQRMRDLDLLRKCRDKNMTHNSTFEVTTFAPQANQAKVIEIVEKLPVSAFTEPLPTITQSEFFLPWLEETSKLK